jgi:hypothetical protein
MESGQTAAACKNGTPFQAKAEEHLRRLFALLRAAGPGGKPPLQILEFRKIGSRDYVAICAVCHLQSAERPLGPKGEANFREAGYPVYRSTPYEMLTRRGFYKDGRFRVVSLLVESFFRSACYRKGQTHCGHCHDLHPSNASANDRGLKAEFIRNPDGMCLQCHADFGGKLTAHTHHARASEGSRCVSCHMPRIMNTVLFKATSHQIGEIPEAAMTARFGQDESPKACQICHSEKDARWTAALLKQWNP